MRVKLSDPCPAPVDGLRSLRKFLLLPRILYSLDTGKREFRWMERATIQQSWGHVDYTEGGGIIWGWVDECFAD